MSSPSKGLFWTLYAIGLDACATWTKPILEHTFPMICFMQLSQSQPKLSSIFSVEVDLWTLLLLMSGVSRWWCSGWTKDWGQHSHCGADPVSWAMTATECQSNTIKYHQVTSSTSSVPKRPTQCVFLQFVLINLHRTLNFTSILHHFTGCNPSQAPVKVLCVSWCILYRGQPHQNLRPGTATKHWGAMEILPVTAWSQWIGPICQERSSWRSKDVCTASTSLEQRFPPTDSQCQFWTFYSSQIFPTLINHTYERQNLA